jgi:acyl transferase domain-containing protein
MACSETSTNGHHLVNGLVERDADDNVHTHVNGAKYLHFPANANSYGGSNGEPTAKSPPRTYFQPIAICGLALRLPGGVRDAASFWDLLSKGRDAVGPMTTERSKTEHFDTISATPRGYFLDENLSHFDPSFFKMSKNELEVADPQQRQLLEVIRECFENAGEVNYRGKTIGCYVGTFGEDWSQMMAKDYENLGTHTFLGSNDLVLANRASYEFDLRGPRYLMRWLSVENFGC